MEQLNHNRCLFCLCKFTPPKITEENDDSSLPPPDFHKLCQFLSIHLNSTDLKQLTNLPTFVKVDGGSDDSNKTCKDFLCLACFDVVDGLSLLYHEFEKIQQKITAVTSAVKKVITAEIDPLLVTVLKKEDDQRKEKDVPSFEFIAAFQRVVKESYRYDLQRSQTQPGTNEDSRDGCRDTEKDKRSQNVGNLGNPEASGDHMEMEEPQTIQPGTSNLSSGKCDADETGTGESSVMQNDKNKAEIAVVASAPVEISRFQNVSVNDITDDDLLDDDLWKEIRNTPSFKGTLVNNLRRRRKNLLNLQRRAGDPNFNPGYGKMLQKRRQLERRRAALGGQVIKDWGPMN